MKILSALLEDYIKTEKSKVASDVSAGNDATIVLENNQGFVDDDYVIVKKEGNEQVHICKINAVVSGNTDIQVDTLKHNLVEGDEVIKILYNQRKLYGCTTETGSYTLKDTKDIEVDNPRGTFFEYTGAEGYLYFKCTYHNATTSEESSIADAVAVLGGESDRYCSLYQIKKQCGLTENPYVEDSIVENKRKQAENEIDSAIAQRYTLPLSEIPALIENITVLLAAGYLDYQEFGGEGAGVKWLGEARGLLKNIIKGQRRLLDSCGDELARKTSAQIKGYPDDSADDTADDRIFSRSDEY